MGSKQTGTCDGLGVLALCGDGGIHSPGCLHILLVDSDDKGHILRVDSDDKGHILRVDSHDKGHILRVDSYDKGHILRVDSHDKETGYAAGSLSSPAYHGKQVDGDL